MLPLRLSLSVVLFSVLLVVVAGRAGSVGCFAAAGRAVLAGRPPALEGAVVVPGGLRLAAA